MPSDGGAEALGAELGDDGLGGVLVVEVGAEFFSGAESVDEADEEADATSECSRFEDWVGLEADAVLTDGAEGFGRSWAAG